MLGIPLFHLGAIVMLVVKPLFVFLFSFQIQKIQMCKKGFVFFKGKFRKQIVIDFVLSIKLFTECIFHPKRRFSNVNKIVVFCREGKHDHIVQDIFE